MINYTILGIIGIIVLAEIYYVWFLKKFKTKHWVQIKFDALMISCITFGLILICALIIRLILICALIIQSIFMNISLENIIKIINIMLPYVYFAGGVSIFLYINYLISKVIRRKKKK